MGLPNGQSFSREFDMAAAAYQKWHFDHRWSRLRHRGWRRSMDGLLRLFKNMADVLGFFTLSAAKWSISRSMLVCAAVLGYGSLVRNVKVCKFRFRAD